MLRGIKKTVETGPRTVRYEFTRADLIKRLRLPADAVLTVQGLIIDAEPGHTLTVEHVVQPRSAKEAA